MEKNPCDTSSSHLQTWAGTLHHRSRSHRATSAFAKKSPVAPLANTAFPQTGGREEVFGLADSRTPSRATLATISAADPVAASRRAPRAPARGGHALSASGLHSPRCVQRQQRWPQSGDRRRASPKSSKPPARATNLIPAGPGRPGLHVWLAVAVAVPRRASRQRLQRGRDLGGRHEADALHLLPNRRDSDGDEGTRACGPFPACPRRPALSPHTLR